MPTLFTSLLEVQAHSRPEASLSEEQRTEYLRRYHVITTGISPLFIDWLKARLPVGPCSTQSGFEEETMRRCGPLLEHAQTMKEGILNPLNRIVFLRAPTGSGKTLSMPELLLFAHGSPETFKMLIVQPQRILVTSTHKSLQLIRHRIRTGYWLGKRRNCRGKSTLSKTKPLPHCLVTVASLGARLLKQAVDNPDSEHAIDVVVIDEAHARSIETNALIDSAVALLNAGKLRQLVFTSASIPGLDELKTRMEKISGFPVHDECFSTRQTFYKTPVTFDRLYARFHYAQLEETERRGRSAADHWLQKQTDDYYKELHNDRRLSRNEKISRVTEAMQTGDLSGSAHFMRRYKDIIDRSPCAMQPKELNLRTQIILEDVFTRIAEVGVCNHPDRCVLILADGLSEILGVERIVKTLLRQMQLPGSIFMLHSTLPEPINVQEPPRENCIKIIITANSGQQGMTFPNLGFIVDMGRSKVPEPRSADCIYALTSRLADAATRDQREGRGGRTCNTRVYYPFGHGVLAEMERQEGLNAKAMINSIGPEEIASWVAEGRRVVDLSSAENMLDPVPKAIVEGAITEGIRMGVFVPDTLSLIRQPSNDDREILTEIGTVFTSVGANRGLSFRLQKTLVAATAAGILSVAVRAVAGCEYGAHQAIRVPKSGGRRGEGGRDDEQFGLNNRHIALPNEEHYAVARFMQWAECFDRERHVDDIRNSEEDVVKLEYVNWNGVDDALRIIDECEVTARPLPRTFTHWKLALIGTLPGKMKHSSETHSNLFSLPDQVITSSDASARTGEGVSILGTQLYPESMSTSSEEFAVYVHGNNVCLQKKIALLTTLQPWQVMLAGNLFGAATVTTSTTIEERPSSSPDSALLETSLSSTSSDITTSSRESGPCCSMETAACDQSLWDRLLELVHSLIVYPSSVEEKNSKALDEFVSSLSSGSDIIQSSSTESKTSYCMEIASNIFHEEGKLVIEEDSTLPNASCSLLSMRIGMETKMAEMLASRFAKGTEESDRLEENKERFYLWMDNFIEHVFAFEH